MREGPNCKKKAVLRKAKHSNEKRNQYQDKSVSSFFDGQRKESKKYMRAGEFSRGGGTTRKEGQYSELKVKK